MATADADVAFQTPNSCPLNSMYNYTKLEHHQKGFKFKVSVTTSKHKSSVILCTVHDNAMHFLHIVLIYY